MITIAIANNKGGAGKTSTARYLARALAKLQSAYHVAGIDLDGQGNLTDCLLGTAPADRPTHGIAQVMAQKLVMWDVLIPIHDMGGWLAPCGAGLDDIADDLVTAPLGVLRLRSAIERQTQEETIYVIDCPPNVGALTYSALIAADYVIIPSTPAAWSINGVKRIVEKVEEIRGALGQAPQVLGTIATQVRATVEHKIGAEALSAPNLPPLLGTVPHRGGVDAAVDLELAYKPIAEQIWSMING